MTQQSKISLQVALWQKLKRMRDSNNKNSHKRKTKDQRAVNMMMSQEKENKSKLKRRKRKLKSMTKMLGNSDANTTEEDVKNSVRFVNNFILVVSAMTRSITKMKWTPKRIISCLEKRSSSYDAMSARQYKLLPILASNVKLSLPSTFAPSANFTTMMATRRKSSIVKVVGSVELEDAKISFTATLVAAA